MRSVLKTFCLCVFFLLCFGGVNAFGNSPKDGRLLIILIDSLQQTNMFNEKHMPFISHCRQRGAWGTSRVVSVPITVSCTTSIFTGVVGSPFDIVNDFSPTTPPSDNFFARASHGGHRVALFGHLLEGMCKNDVKLIHDKMPLSQYHKEANFIFNEATEYMKKGDWDIVALATYSLDYIGHLETPRSSNYPAMLRAIDDHVKKLIELTTEQDTVLILTEHGMDNNGFHMERVPDVMEPGFILWGPHVKKGGPKTVLQIDWAPTLALLIGVAPVYPSPALPALHLIDIPLVQETALLNEFAQLYGEKQHLLSLDELQKRRSAWISRGIFSSRFSAVLTVLSVGIASGVLAYIVFGGIGWMLSSFYIFAGILSFSGIFNLISSSFPFSANFIKSHPLGIPVTFILMAFVPRVITQYSVKLNTTFFFGLIAVIFTGILSSSNPEPILNWTIFMVVPLVGWGLSRHPAWLTYFLALWTGLLIRRLTFYKAYTPINFPDREIICLTALIICLVYAWVRIRNDEGKWRTLGIGALCSLPAIGVILLTSGVEIRAALLLLCLIPLAYAIVRAPLAWEVWAALWVAFFYLGTSSSIPNLTHIAAIPLLISVWTLAQGLPPVLRGILGCITIWTFSFWPGNGFTVMLPELSDYFILGTATNENIGYTVMVIFGRYSLPAAILFWGLQRVIPRSPLLTIIAAALLPVVSAIGLLLGTMAFNPAGGYPWEDIMKLTVLAGYVVIVISAFVCVLGTTVMARTLEKWRASKIHITQSLAIF